MFVEPVFTVDGTRFKPDLVIVKESEVAVVDVSIVTAKVRFGHKDESKLKDAWLQKQRYYDKPGLRLQLTRKFETTNITFGAVILSVRGIWCSRNDSVLRSLGGTKRDVNTMVVRSMEGSIRTWKQFMHATRGMIRL